jgi:hypothetical protein
MCISSCRTSSASRTDTDTDGSVRTTTGLINDYPNGPIPLKKNKSFTRCRVSPPVTVPFRDSLGLAQKEAGALRAGLLKCRCVADRT